MVALVHLAILAATLLTYVYLGRAGYLVFFGAKNGHRSIYRVRHQSIVITAALGLLGAAAAYSGIV